MPEYMVDMAIRMGTNCVKPKSQHVDFQMVLNWQELTGSGLDERKMCLYATVQSTRLLDDSPRLTKETNPFRASVTSHSSVAPQM